MSHTNNSAVLMDDPNALLEMAHIREFLTSRGVPASVPFRDVPGPLRTEACFAASLRLAAHEVGDGWRQARQAYVRGPGDGCYRVHRAVARGRSARLCELCGGEAGSYYAGPPWWRSGREEAWLADEMPECE